MTVISLLFYCKCLLGYYRTLFYIFILQNNIIVIKNVKQNNKIKIKLTFIYSIPSLQRRSAAKFESFDDIPANIFTKQAIQSALDIIKYVSAEKSKEKQSNNTDKIDDKTEPNHKSPKL